MNLDIQLLNYQPDLSFKTCMCSAAWRKDMSRALVVQSIVHACVSSTSSSTSWCLQEAGGSGCVSQSSVVVLCQHPHFLSQVLLKAAFLTHLSVSFCRCVHRCDYLRMCRCSFSSVICGRKFKRFPVLCVVNVCCICSE